MQEQGSPAHGGIPHVDCDVLVAGSGISGLSAAISAREEGADSRETKSRYVYHDKRRLF